MIILERILHVNFISNAWMYTDVSENCRRIKLGKLTFLFCGMHLNAYMDGGVFFPMFVQGLIGYCGTTILIICGIIAYSVNYLYMINSLFLLYVGLAISGVALVINAVIFIVLAIKNAKAIKKSKKNK